jgi:phage terminase small subunit
VDIMASASRALTLKLLADVDNFTKNLNKADGEVTSFGSKVTNFGKKAGLAFAAAGAAAAAYAGKLAIDGVKAAIEDEAAQIRLATSLKNVTGATEAQISATEDYILKTSLAKGVTDDELRPSLDRLVKSVKSVEEAQKLQTIAIDVAAGSGKSLEAVTNAMARAAEGNTASLGRLGIGLSKAELATMSMDEITAKLAQTFEGQASKQADTFQGKMGRLKIAFDEGKETVGSFILDAITPMVDFIVQKVVPGVQKFIDSIGGKEGIGNALTNFITVAKSIFIPVFQGIQSAFKNIKSAVEDNKEEFQALFEFLGKYVAPFLGGVFKLAIQGIGIAIGVVLDAVGALIRGFQTLINLGSKIGGAIGGVFGGGRAAGGPVMAGTTYLVGEKGPELFTPSSSGRIIPNSAMGGGSTINLTVNGAIDPEGTARTIVNILNNSAARGTLGAGALVIP